MSGLLRSTHFLDLFQKSPVRRPHAIYDGSHVGPSSNPSFSVMPTMWLLPSQRRIGLLSWHHQIRHLFSFGCVFFRRSHFCKDAVQAFNKTHVAARLSNKVCETSKEQRGMASAQNELASSRRPHATADCHFAASKAASQRIDRPSLDGLQSVCSEPQSPSACLQALLASARSCLLSFVMIEKCLWLSVPMLNFACSTKSASRPDQVAAVEVHI